MRFRKKPVVIEAEQWTDAENPPDGVEVKPDGMFYGTKGEYAHAYGGYIKTLEGTHIVSIGDWIITGVKGEKYPCKPNIFEMTYEPIEEGGEES